MYLNTFILMVLLVSCGEDALQSNNELSNKGHVKGKVLVAKTLELIKNAEVSIYNYDSSGQMCNEILTRTDSIGLYSFNSLDTGEYYMNVNYSNYKLKNGYAIVKPRKTTIVDFQLEESVYIDKTAYIEVEVECSKKWEVEVSIDGNTVSSALGSGLETYKVKEGQRKVEIREAFNKMCEKYGKIWTYNFYLKRGTTKTIKAKCCE